ncbi:MAG TPA: hypothetical protein PKE30_02665 [Niabella sp.]|nr:hypothetical protein [Niabella sp.]
MKTKLLVTAAFLFSTFLTANAQIEKGTWIIGGAASYNTLKDESLPQLNSPKTVSSKGGIFGLNVGFAFKENNILGLIATYAPSTFHDETPLEEGIVQTRSTKGHQKGIGAFYRGYKLLGDKFFLFGQTSAWYANGKYSLNENMFKMNSVDLSLSPGLAYQVLNNVHLEISIPNIFQIGYSKSENPGLNASNELFYAHANLRSNPIENLGIGFKILLP